MPQADPRTDPKVSFLDLIEIKAEIEDTSRSTRDTLKEAKTEGRTEDRSGGRLPNYKT